MERKSEKNVAKNSFSDVVRYFLSLKGEAVVEELPPVETLERARPRARSLYE